MLDLKDFIQPAQEVLAPVAGTLGDTWQALIGDRVAAWRLENAISTYKHLREEVKKEGLRLNASKIPERYAFAWFEEATKQDEPEIQILFARLLARASAGDEHASDRRHLAVLNQMTPSDAQIFKRLFDPFFGPPSEYTAPRFAAMATWESQSISGQLVVELGTRAMLDLEHLKNLGILVEKVVLERAQHSRSLNGDPPATAVRYLLQATQMGLSLYLAVRETPPPPAAEH